VSKGVDKKDEAPVEDSSDFQQFLNNLKTIGKYLIENERSANAQIVVLCMSLANVMASYSLFDFAKLDARLGSEPTST
jgi:hypothetical protein